MNMKPSAPVPADVASLLGYADKVRQMAQNTHFAIDTINNWMNDLDKDGHSDETKKALRDMADDVLFFLGRGK